MTMGALLGRVTFLVAMFDHAETFVSHYCLVSLFCVLQTDVCKREYELINGRQKPS